MLSPSSTPTVHLHTGGECGDPESETALRVEEELVEFVKDKNGLACVKYRSDTCGLLKQCKYCMKPHLLCEIAYLNT